MKEGEKEEKQATLVTDRLIYDEFLFYLPVIADTFAVIAPAEIFHGYISTFDNGAVTIDRQIWATDESEYWKPEYNEDAGFEVVDAEGEDITCCFYICH